MSSAFKIYALFIGSALLMFGGGLQGLLLSVRGAEEGFSLLALGLIGTGWSVGFVAGSITVPMLVQRVGHIRAFSIMAAIGTEQEGANNSIPMTSLIWLRIDLRLADNPALHAAVQRGGAIVPAFIYAPEEEAPWSPGGASRWWLHQSLKSLDVSLRALGSRLVIRRGPSLRTL